MNDDRWSKLDNAVHSKLYKCHSISDRIDLLQNTIYEEGCKIFGLSSAKVSRNLSGKSRRTYRSIQLIQLKNSLIGQISAASIPDQRTALEQLLNQVRSKIRCMRSAESGRKKRWKFKRAQLAFKNNPYKAGRDLLDPKCKASLHVDQETLDHHKSATVADISSKVPLVTLEGLPPAPSISKKFSNASLEYAHFERILITRRNASSPGLNGISYKVYKNCPKISAFLFNIFMCCFNHCVVPIQWRHAISILV